MATGVPGLLACSHAIHVEAQSPSAISNNPTLQEATLSFFLLQIREFVASDRNPTATTDQRRPSSQLRSASKSTWTDGSIGIGLGLGLGLGWESGAHRTISGTLSRTTGKSEHCSVNPSLGTPAGTMDLSGIPVTPVLLYPSSSSASASKVLPLQLTTYCKASAVKHGLLHYGEPCCLKHLLAQPCRSRKLPCL